MTATESLRQLLDERGVKWEEPDPYQDATAWVGSNNIEYVAHEGISFDGPTGRLILFCLTPEQAVEATLGPREQLPYDELIESLRRDWDIEASWDGLRRFWYVGLTDEGVRKRDEREATLGRGTCKMEATLTNPFETRIDEYHCSECGEYCSVEKVMGKTEPPKFCPECGRRVEE